MRTINFQNQEHLQDIYSQNIDEPLKQLRLENINNNSNKFDVDHTLFPELFHLHVGKSSCSTTDSTDLQEENAENYSCGSSFVPFCVAFNVALQ